MQSIELILDFSLYIVWYGFWTLFIFDFLLGLFALMNKSFATPSVQSIQAVRTDTQSTQLALIKETENDELSEASVRPKSKADEATIQYLEMTGCDINDFASITEARKFLDQYAPWTIEPQPVQAEAQSMRSLEIPVQAQSQLILLIPDPWFEPIDELQQVQENKASEIEPFPTLKLLAPSKTKVPKRPKSSNKSRSRARVTQFEVLTQPASFSKAVRKNTSKERVKSTEAKASLVDDELQATKLSFNQVCMEFAEIGLAFERYRSGHYCYRVVFGCDCRCRFKTLQEAMDWLAVRKQSEQSAHTKPDSITELQITKLSFNQICLGFEKLGYKFERHRSGKFRYRLITINGFFCFFKTLQEAVDCLTLNQQPKRTITVKASTDSD
jgi:hypothetical protein